MVAKAKELAMILSRLSDIGSPNPDLEQWTTPSDLASEIIFYAYNHGDIEGRICADFGCGNGIFAIGMALMGAERVYAVEIDEMAINVAKKNCSFVEELYGPLPIVFINEDVRRINLRVDTIIMNPPFGLERGTRHADRYFLIKGFECSDTIYSLHHSSRRSRKFLDRLAGEYGFSLSFIKTYAFPLKARFWFHRRERKNILIDFLVFRRLQSGIHG